MSRETPLDDAVPTERLSPEWKREQRYAKIATANQRHARKISELRKQIAMMRDPNIDNVTRMHVPTDMTRGLVRQLAAVGVKPGRIALRMHLPLDEFKSHYGEDCKEAFLGTRVKVLGTYVRMATDPDHPSAERAGRKWLEVNEPGWKEVKRIETDDVSKRRAQVIDSSRLTQEERDELRRLLMKTTTAEPLGLAGAHEDESVVAEQESEDDMG